MTSLQVCRQAMDVLKEVCKEINIPIAPEKSQGPVTLVEFLELTLDIDFMVVRVPLDKLRDRSNLLCKMIKNRKATSWELQSLAKLNFMVKAVSAGKCFIKGIYQAQAGIPHH